MKTRQFTRSYLREMENQATGGTWTGWNDGLYAYIDTSAQRFLPRKDKQLIDPRALAQLPVEHGANGEVHAHLLAAARNALPAILDDLDELAVLELNMDSIRQMATGLLTRSPLDADTDDLQRIVRLASRGSRGGME